jgi:polyisoprenoid-binding protein YceI
MKNQMKSLLLLFVTALAVMSFTIAPSVYNVDKAKSKITWKGSKVVGEHSGTIDILNASFTSEGKKITGGSFEIDMTSIKNTDITDAGYNANLVGHLKSEDFFSVVKFPKSTFLITKLTSKGKNEFLVNGKLTIKGITNDLEFPATIVINGDQITANAKITVDRTKFDIKYGSGSFFDNLGDKAISNNFELDVQLVAAK